MGHSHLWRLSPAAPALILAISLVLPASAAAATDSDRDYLPNAWERWYSLTSPYRADTDRDGVPDASEDPVMHELDVITGRDLQVVDTTGLVNGP